MTNERKRPYGWRGTIHDFLLVPKDEWRSALYLHHVARMNRPADTSQGAAWEELFDVLKKELKQLVQLKPELEYYTLIFEYESPRGSIRGPDLTVLGSSVFILEFRKCDEVIQAHVDITDAYAQDIKRFHPQPEQAEIIPVLVCAQAKDLIRRTGDVIILSPDHIMDFFNVQSELETGFPLDAGEWLAAGS